MNSVKKGFGAFVLFMKVFPRTLAMLFMIVMLVLFAAVMAHAASNVKLAWDPNSENDLAGYKLHYGLASGSYSTTINVGNVTVYTVENLPDGTYFFAVTAYDTSSNESGYSNEVSDLLDTVPPADVQNLIIQAIINVSSAEP